MVQKKTHVKPTPVDEGWSWVILASAILVFGIGGSVIKNFGLLFADILHTFGKSAASTAFIPSTHFAVLAFSGSLGNYLCSKYNIRTIVMTGGFIYSMGYLATAFVPEMELMYITAAIAGFGAGLCMSMTILMVTYYFDKYRAKAVGLVTCSTGIVTFGLPHLYLKLQERFGLRGEIMIISGILLHMCVGASFWRQPIRAPPVSEPDDVDRDVRAIGLTSEFGSCASLAKSIEVLPTSKSKTIENTNGITNQKRDDTMGKADVTIELEPMLKGKDGSHVDDKKETEQTIHFDFWIIKNPDFLVTVLSLFLGTFAFFLMSIILPVHTEERTGVIANKAILMMCLGGGDTLGKPLSGAIVDMKIVRVRTLWSFNLVISAIVTLCQVYAESIVTICVLAAVWSFFTGSMFMLHMLAHVETLGTDKLPSCLALANLFNGVANFIGSPLAGLIKDTTGRWDGAFVLASAVFLTGAIVLQTRRVWLYFHRTRPS